MEQRGTLCAAVVAVASGEAGVETQVEEEMEVPCLQLKAESLPERPSPRGGNEASPRLQSKRSIGRSFGEQSDRSRDVVSWAVC